CIMKSSLHRPVYFTKYALIVIGKRLSAEFHRPVFGKSITQPGLEKREGVVFIVDRQLPGVAPSADVLNTEVDFEVGILVGKVEPGALRDKCRRIRALRKRRTETVAVL